MDVELKSYCQLLSTDNLHPPIELVDGKPIVIGRGPLTKITSKKCSRKQVELVANYASEEVILKHIGINPSKVGCQYIQQGDKCTLGPGGVFELVGEYKYSIFFGKKLTQKALELLRSDSPPDEESKPGPLPRNHPITEHEISAECCAKRLKLDTDMDTYATEISVIKKEKQKFLESFFMPPTTTDGLKPEWCEYGTLILFHYGHQCPSAKIAAFDLDNTLIETASGKRFPTGPHDWKFMSFVRDKLNMLYHSGFRIVIFTNQVGVPKGKPTKAEFKQKVEGIAQKLALPILVLISTGRDMYRKPCTGMWDHMVHNENGELQPDTSCSVYVGDAAGRLADWRPGAKKDFSDTDRKFALNIGLTFATPEEYFQGYPKCKRFSLGVFDPRSTDTTKHNPELKPVDAALTSFQPEMVVFVGCPASGKTTFYETIMKPKGYCHINRDTLGSWQKCIAMCDKELQNGRSVTVDNTNPDADSRLRYIKCARKHGYPVRCFQFMTSLEQAKHNNKFRELTTKDSSYVKVTDIAFNVYKSKFVEPNLKEGFCEIVQITIHPSFHDEKLVCLYKKFLY